MLIASALTTQDEKALAKCMNIASQLIIKNEIELSKEWDKYQIELKKYKWITNTYDNKLIDLWIYPGIESNCYNSMEIYLKETLHKFTQLQLKPATWLIKYKA